jgi:hypothetical protein
VAAGPEMAGSSSLASIRLGFSVALFKMQSPFIDAPLHSKTFVGDVGRVLLIARTSFPLNMHDTIVGSRFTFGFVLQRASYKDSIDVVDFSDTHIWVRTVHNARVGVSQHVR